MLRLTFYIFATIVSGVILAVGSTLHPEAWSAPIFFLILIAAFSYLAANEIKNLKGR